MTFSKSILKKISTSDTKKPDSPQIIIQNPLDDDTFVNGIELILSPEFSKKGKLLIEINDITEFDANDSEAFDGYAKFPIPLSKKFRRGHDIKIFAWNGSGDSNTIKMSLNTSISKNPEPFNSQAVPLGKDVFNTVVSDNSSLFQTKNWSNETETKLIDMEGFKKMILVIASNKTLLPIVDSSLGYTDVDPNTIDGDLATKTPNASMTLNDYTTHFVIVDFGSIAVRGLGGKVQHFHGGSSSSTVFSILEYSDDKISWNTQDEQSSTNTGSTAIDKTLGGIQRSYRYARVSQKKTNGSAGTAGIFEIFDGDVLGGQADISFELLDTTLNRFIEYISAGSIGSQSFGVDKTIIIGDVINDLANNKFNFAIPSSQTDFRAKIIVTGNLNVGVSIIKVA